MATEKKTTTRKQKEAAPEVEEKIEPTPAPAEQTYTESELMGLVSDLRQQIEALKAQIGGQSAAPAQTKPEEVVVLYYVPACSPDNEANLGDYGVVRPGQYIEIPKKEFGRFMGPQARKFVEKRRLLVLSGLNEEERRRWNCDYRLGETLTENAFDGLLDLSEAKIADLFRALCPEHKKAVVRFLYSKADEAQRRGELIDNRIDLSKVRTLNDLSKSVEPEGMLNPLIERIKAQL